MPGSRACKTTWLISHLAIYLIKSNDDDDDEETISWPAKTGPFLALFSSTAQPTDSRPCMAHSSVPSDTELKVSGHQTFRAVKTAVAILH